jgi:hypothetical protein
MVTPGAGERKRPWSLVERWQEPLLHATASTIPDDYFIAATRMAAGIVANLARTGVEWRRRRVVTRASVPAGLAVQATTTSIPKGKPRSLVTRVTWF